MVTSNAGDLPQDRVYRLVETFRNSKVMWQVRIEASRALLDLEFHSKGINAALLLFIKYVEEELSLRGCALFVAKNLIILLDNTFSRFLNCFP